MYTGFTRSFATAPAVQLGLPMGRRPPRRRLPRSLPRAARAAVARAAGTPDRADRSRSRARPHPVHAGRDPDHRGKRGLPARLEAGVSAVWLAVVLVGAATVLLKATGPVMLGGRELPPRVNVLVVLLAPGRPGGARRHPGRRRRTRARLRRPPRRPRRGRRRRRFSCPTSRRRGRCRRRDGRCPGPGLVVAHALGGGVNNAAGLRGGYTTLGGWL